MTSLPNGAARSRKNGLGSWRMQWSQDSSQNWKARKWEIGEETLSAVSGPAFIDVTEQALGGTESYAKQMLRGKITGGRFSMARLVSMYMATMAWRREISITTASMISMFASQQGCPIGSTAIAAMERLRM